MPLDVADHFRGTVSIWASVTSVDGSRQITFDDSTPVHKQLIDIKYSKETRKQFKPGLPYKGKVSQQKCLQLALIFISVSEYSNTQVIIVCCLSFPHPPCRLRWPTLMGAQLMGWVCVLRQSWHPRTTCTPVSWLPKTARQPLKSPPSPLLPSMFG